MKLLSVPTFYNLIHGKGLPLFMPGKPWKKERIKALITNVKERFLMARDVSVYGICHACIMGHEVPCERPDDCPCVCNESSFPLNIIRNRKNGSNRKT